MNLLDDIITYVRRIVKTPLDSVLSNNLIIDYINRFWINDVPARVQTFDLKKTYEFQTTPGFDQYNMPLYSVQTVPATTSNPSNEITINYYPVYQGFMDPVYVNGIQIPFFTQKSQFLGFWPFVPQNMTISITGDGTTGPYAINLPIQPQSQAPQNPPFNCLLRGHVDMQGIIASGSTTDPITGASFTTTIPTTSVTSKVFISALDASNTNMVIADSGQFLSSNINYGLLMNVGQAPYGNTALSGGYSTTVNTVNYFTGTANVYFPNAVPAGNAINAQCYYYQAGLPRGVLFYNNTLTFRNPPDRQYLVQMDAYMTPAAFLATSDALPFGYMAEYIARGAARKILSDTGDIEQFQFYEPLFREQERLVQVRAERIWTSTRTQTIYSTGPYSGAGGYSNFGGNL